jgi:chromosome segregation ATPase
MFKPFLQQLTKVTDLAILFATIFVFLAFITPEELSQTPLNNARDDYDRTTSSLALAEAEGIASRVRLEESISVSIELTNSIVAIKTAINSIDTELVEDAINNIGIDADQDITDQLNAELDQLNAELDQLNAERDQLNAELDQLNMELITNESQLQLFRETSEEASNNIVMLRNQLKTIEKTIADIKTAALSSKAVSWLQPVRTNTNELINAAGFDGFIAGFAALIFCLVCRRRQTWFKQMFGIYFK